MILGVLFDQLGLHPAAWRHPDAPRGGALDLQHFINLAQTAERGCLDFVFFADGLAVRRGNPEIMKRGNIHISHFEPITLLSALATATTNIGLAATASTSFSEPYNVARQFASLDHLSHGRVGWNVVTTSDPDAAANFGTIQARHDSRYARATEHVEICQQLWDSWADDALIEDRDSGIYYDPAGLRDINYEGTHFKVRGPLNISRPPQGRPVLISAGSSPQGRDFAASSSDVIFALSSTIAAGQAFYQDQKSRMAAYGRTPDQLKILCGLTPYVGRTQSEAEDIVAGLDGLIHPDVGRAYVSVDLGVDLTGLPVDEPIPDHLLPVKTDRAQSYMEAMLTVIRRDRPTLKRVYEMAAASRGDMRPVIGTPASIADLMEEWVSAGATDGFMLMPHYLPGGIDRFVELVIPELQRRGLFRKSYQHSTLRGHLGLARPDLPRATAQSARQTA